MSDTVQILATYLHLAKASELRRRIHVRDRLLVLAATVACLSRLPRIAAYCRRKILDHNPRHIIGQSENVKTAFQDEEFVALLKQLQIRYSVERAEHLLTNLGVEYRNERAAYYTDEEYAASLLGITPVTLDELFGQSQS